MIDEKLLVAQLKQTDSQEQAFRNLMTLYKKRLYWHIRKIVLSHEDADDVLQNTFIKVFKNIQGFKGEVTIGAWIKKIIINQCIDYLKKKKIELVSMDDKELHVADEGDWKVQDGTTVQMITAAINSLPEKYKVVLNMYLLEGYDHQEIAQVLNISEVNSRSQLMRGKNKLKSQLKQYNYA